MWSAICKSAKIAVPFPLSQDAPSGFSLRVQSHKNDGRAGFCMKCFYIKRGSFSGLKSMEFAEMLASNPSLKDKCFSCIVKFRANFKNIKNQESLLQYGPWPRQCTLQYCLHLSTFGLLRRLLSRFVEKQPSYMLHSHICALEALMSAYRTCKPMLRFKSLRKKHVHVTCLNPKARPRHEAINVALYTEQKESTYVDFFQEFDCGNCDGWAGNE